MLARKLYPAYLILVNIITSVGSYIVYSANRDLFADLSEEVTPPLLWPILIASSIQIAVAIYLMLTQKRLLKKNSSNILITVILYLLPWAINLILFTYFIYFPIDKLPDELCCIDERLFE